MSFRKYCILLFLPVLAACINNPSADDTFLTEYSVGIVYAEDDSYSEKIINVLGEFLDEDEYALSFYDEFSDGNLETEAEKTDILLNTYEVDYLVVMPSDADDISSLTESASYADTPLIFIRDNPFSDDMPPSDVYYTGYDPDSSAGEIQAEYLCELMDDEGEVFIIRGPEDDETADEMTEDYLTVLYSTDIEILDARSVSSWDTAKLNAKSYISAYLEANENAIDGILANSDAAALGAVEALIAAGRTDVYVIGYGGTDSALAAVADETLTATVGEPAESVGEFCTDLIANLRCNIEVSGIVYHSQTIITISNVEDFQ